MKFETLYQELVSSTEMIRTLLADITQEEAQFKSSPETWSILEVLCHLYDEEREDFRGHLDFILHRQSEEWHRIEPQGWVAARKYNEQNFVRMQDKFFTERWISLEWLKGISDANWDITCKSPFGHASAGEMLASWIAHDNLHIRQLIELRRGRIENIAQPYSIEYAGDW
jgi:hypothetical protein